MCLFIFNHSVMYEVSKNVPLTPFMAPTVNEVGETHLAFSKEEILKSNNRNCESVASLLGEKFIFQLL